MARSGRKKNVGGCIFFGELESRGYDIDPDHSGRTESFCDRHAKETHGTGPPYGDGLSCTEAGDVGNSMNRDGKRLNLHPELAGGKLAGGMEKKTIAASSKVMLSGMRYETPAGRR